MEHETGLNAGNAALSAPKGCAAAERIDGLGELLDRFVADEVSRSHEGEALGYMERLMARVLFHMCDLSRRLAVANPDADIVDLLKHNTRLSGRDARKIVQVAGQLEEMPEMAGKLASGDITLDHAVALVKAAELVGSDVVEGDPLLLQDAVRMPPDTFARRARDWANRILLEAGVDVMGRHLKAREARLWTDPVSGMGMVFAKLPAVRFAQLQQVLDRRYVELLRQDSVDGRNPDEVRSPKHRLADAVFELLTNLDPTTGELLPESRGRAGRASTQLVIVADRGVVDGTNPGGRCEIIGVGPVPPQILRSLSPDTQLAGMIFGGAGRPLWLGRSQRLANAPQRLAVAVRDGGCFRCGAPMHLCELHHIREWHRDGGPTDVDNLVAVCRRHHRWLETDDLEVQPDADGGYQAIPRTRPPP